MSGLEKFHLVHTSTANFDTYVVSAALSSNKFLYREFYRNSKTDFLGLRYGNSMTDSVGLRYHEAKVAILLQSYCTHGIYSV